MKSFIRKLERNDDITIEFVGDSITHGLNHCREDETYVAKFALLISKRFKNYTVCRYDGVVADELSPMKSFDGPIFVSQKENQCRIDVIKITSGALPFANTPVKSSIRFIARITVLPPIPFFITSILH